MTTPTTTPAPTVPVGLRDGSTYRPAQNFGLLIVGEPGSGKTRLGFEFPDLGILDCDRNLRSAIVAWKEKHGSLKPFKYAAPDQNEKGEAIPLHDIWPNAQKQAAMLCADPAVGTIFIDGLSLLQDWLMRYLVTQGSGMEKPLTVGGIKVMTKSLYNPLEMAMKDFLVNLRASGKRVVVSSHVKIADDEITNASGVKPALQGALRDKVAGLFTDFWMCETLVVTPTDENKRKYPTGVRYYVRTVPTTRVKLKNSMGLPPEFEFTWEALEPYLNKAQQEAPAVTTTPAKP
jgi:AAA domain-containing protein